jgi:hypothetical protein
MVHSLGQPTNRRTIQRQKIHPSPTNHGTDWTSRIITLIWTHCHKDWPGSSVVVERMLLKRVVLPLKWDLFTKTNATEKWWDYKYQRKCLVWSLFLLLLKVVEKLWYVLQLMSHSPKYFDSILGWWRRQITSLIEQDYKSFLLEGTWMGGRDGISSITRFRWDKSMSQKLLGRQHPEKKTRWVAKNTMAQCSLSQSTHTAATTGFTFFRWLGNLSWLFLCQWVRFRPEGDWQHLRRISLSRVYVEISCLITKDNQFTWENTHLELGIAGPQSWW